MFSDLWPGFDESDVPIGSITNGVHAPTWTARELVEMGTQTTSQGDPVEVDGPVALRRRRQHQGRPTCGASAGRCARRLVEEVRRRIRETALSRGATEAEVGWTATAFDPDVLTIGFARRVPSYKRLTLMLRDPERLKALLLDPERPIQLIIAGKSHPADDGGKKLIQEMVAFADDPEIRHRIAFLPGYDIGMARYLYWGCDVWLNNPLRPLEACGTSGMKAALNGGLNLSIRDGWWDEWFDGQNGWAIPTADGVADPDRRDEVEARAIYELLEQPGACRGSTRPAATASRPAGSRWCGTRCARPGPRCSPPGWCATTCRRCTCRPPARRGRWPPTATRPAREEAGVAGAPAAELAGRAGGPRRGDRRRGHPGDRVDARPARRGGAAGARRRRDVQVQAAYGRVDDADGLHQVTTVPMAHEHTDGSRHWFTATVPLERTGAFGYTVRVLPHSERMADPAELGVVTQCVTRSTLVTLRLTRGPHRTPCDAGESPGVAGVAAASQTGAAITRLEAMPDRCEVLPGDSVVARRGGGLLWVDAPGSPALVAALHACLGVSGPGADRVLSAVAGQVSSLAHGPASFALVLADTSGGAGTGVALWSGKGQPAVDGVPVSGSSVEGCTLASGFTLGQTPLRRPRRSRRRRCRRASPTTSSRAPCPAPARCCSWPRAVSSAASAVPPATSRPRRSVHRGSDAGFGAAAGSPRPSAPGRSPVSRPPSGGPSRRPRRCCASTTAWSSPSTRTWCSAAVPTTTSW